MTVLVINADLGPLHRVSVSHAVRMLWRNVAVIHEADSGSTVGPYPLPLVVRLVNYVVTRWRHARPPSWSRKGVLTRDHRRCAYCRRAATTVDHILPVSRGGASTWLNTVAACYACNQAKGGATPAEAGMRLMAPPVIPTWVQVATV